MGLAKGAGQQEPQPIPGAGLLDGRVKQHRVGHHRIHTVIHVPGRNFGLKTGGEDGGRDVLNGYPGIRDIGSGLDVHQVDHALNFIDLGGNAVENTRLNTDDAADAGHLFLVHGFKNRKINDIPHFRTTAHPQGMAQGVLQGLRGFWQHFFPRGAAEDGLHLESVIPNLCGKGGGLGGVVHFHVNAEQRPRGIIYTFRTGAHGLPGT
ncbi:MAG: hypothetical protein BWX80_03431 [Candidatus Hydrogenedentes bacterium ADurb.Bin101]|nr:MAG: hypothetical protein BWX80_03431 [Candidatus Hydrogenedentes bacterium ADurb.Bin101]